MHEGTSQRKNLATKPWRRGALTALAALVTIAASLALPAGVARADESPPLVATFPPAGETAPPAEAITSPSTCGAWHQQSSYGGVWATGSTWWEYTCTHSWPQSGGGATNADWGGEYIWISYYYWDGSKPVLYGQWFWDGYFDSMFYASNCWYWSNFATGEGQGPLYCYDNYWLGLSEIGA
jgi:hypothetical protein